MKKKRKKSQAKPTEIPINAKKRTPKMGRRKLLMHLRNSAIATVALAGGGYFAVTKVQATIAEHDLSKVGNGTPSIVQIHDPQCPVCLALQREVRDALDNFEQGDFEYLVANIRSKEGSTFANNYFVPHVTLLLFNGQGALVKVLNGPNKSDFLQAEFKAHLAAST